MTYKKHDFEPKLTVSGLIDFLLTCPQDAQVAVMGDMGGTVSPIAEAIIDDLLVAPDDATFATIGHYAGKAGFSAKKHWDNKGFVVVLDKYF